MDKYRNSETALTVGHASTQYWRKNYVGKTGLKELQARVRNADQS